MPEPGRVLVVGSANMDLVVRAPRLPAAGETVLGGDLLRVPGGKGANQAVAAARAGAAVRIVAAVGADSFGRELLAALRADGVDVSAVTTLADRPSGAALIVVDATGQNQIAVAPGANAALVAACVEPALADLRPNDVVALQLEVPPETVRHACLLARRAGARTLLNAAPAIPLPADLLALVDLLVVNEGEAALLAGCPGPEQAAARLRQLGPGCVVVTLGQQGVLLADERGKTRVAAHRVRVVDTTAAGDAFCGALAAALAAGADLREAAEFANAAGALAATRPGAQSSLPRRRDIEALLA